MTALTFMLALLAAGTFYEQVVPKGGRGVSTTSVTCPLSRLSDCFAYVTLPKAGILESRIFQLY